jgi:uncharacterized protein with HEPN domain
MRQESNMPPIDDVVRIRHIIEAAEKAARFLHGKRRADFETNEMLKLALIRILEIIGEAASGISEKSRRLYPKVAWKQMAAMRNRLIHGYFEVNNDLVWETVTKELPPLAIDLRRALKKETK